MKVQVTNDMSPKADIMAIFQNSLKTITIMVLSDVSYEVVKNGYTQKFDMTKWYSYPLQVITHIENDIVAGYYPNVRRIA
jgi:hypothetical protein